MLRPLKLALSAPIDPRRKTPIYLQIIQAIVRDIESGRLAKGSFMPSSRELAAELGVNRKTVVLAYEDLIAQGWLSAQGTRGTAVSDALPEPARPVRTAPRPPVQVDYRHAAPPERSLALAPAAIKLDEGTPDGRLFPADLLARAYRGAIQRAGRNKGFQYRDPRGHPALREAVAAMLRAERGLAVTAANICITRGSQNGIFLAAQTLVRPGTAAVFEALTYEPAVAAFRACGAEIVTAGVDEHGIVVADVERACRRHSVRALFLTPHHQFPTTVALRPERRLRLLALARQFGFAIVEDDYDYEFHFETQPLLPMAAYAPAHVIYVGSLSKLMLPALRIGYVAAPEPVIDAFAHFVSVTDGMGNTLTEDAAAELITAGELKRHGRKVRQIYRARRDAFAEGLAATFGDRARFAVPDGGLAFWLRFADPGDIARLEAGSAAAGIGFAAAASYALDPAAPPGLRFGFASLDDRERAAALRALAGVLAAG